LPKRKVGIPVLSVCGELMLEVTFAEAEILLASGKLGALRRGARLFCRRCRRTSARKTRPKRCVGDGSAG
jgi:hypothetical protein